MKTILFLFALLLAICKAEGQNYKFQALYLFNIAQQIEWPSSNSNFNIGVIGSSELEKELNTIFQTRKLSGVSVKVSSISSTLAGAENCQLLYLARSLSSKISNVTDLITNKPVLLVSDKSGLTGAGINLIDESTRLEFEIYPTIIEAHGLKLSNSLLNLGIVKH